MDESSRAEVVLAHVADELDLSDRLVGKLRTANRRLVDWLARDPENRRLFLERPIAALIEAGVELTHGEKQTLIRAHQTRRGASPARDTQARA